MRARSVRWVIACVAGLAIAVSLGIVAAVSHFGGQPGPQPPLRLGLIEWPGFYHFMAAARDGSYTAASVAVETTVFAGNPEANSAFAQGRIDLLLGVLPDALMLAAHGTDLRIIAAIDHSDRADVILVHPSITSFDQLRGRPVSFEEVNSFSHLYVLQVLAKAGIPESAMRFVNLPANEVPKALADGRIVGGHTWGPLAREAMRSGYRILHHAGADPGMITEVLSARGDVLRDRGDQVRRFLAATFAAQARYAQDEPAVMAHAAAMLGKPMGDLSPVTGEVQILDRATSRQRMGSDDPLSLHRLATFAVEQFRSRNQLPPGFTWASLIDPNWLDPAPPSR